MRRQGFSLIELMASLSIILLVTSFSVISAKSISISQKKQLETNQFLSAGIDFLEFSKTLSFPELINYQTKNLIHKKIELKIKTLNSNLYQIVLKEINSGTEISTLRYHHE